MGQTPLHDVKKKFTTHTLPVISFSVKTFPSWVVNLKGFTKLITGALVLKLEASVNQVSAKKKSPGLRTLPSTTTRNKKIKATKKILYPIIFLRILCKVIKAANKKLLTEIILQPCCKPVFLFLWRENYQKKSTWIL